MDQPICKTCDQTFTEKKHKLSCSSCQQIYHRTCLPVMSSAAYQYAKINWNCSSCQQNKTMDDEKDEDKSDSPSSSSIPFLPNRLEDSFFNKTVNVPNECEEPQYSPVLPKGLKYAHLNVNGIKSKFFEIQRFLSNEKNIMVLGITESKLDQYRDFTREFEVPEYNLLRFDREHKEGGGTLLYVNKVCDCSEVELNISKPNLIECNIICIARKEMKTMLVCTVYVPPTKVNLQFFEYFRSVCNFLKQQKAGVLIMGDFNIALLDNSLHKNHLLDITNEFNYVQMINAATRIAATKIGDTTRITSKLIDHMYLDLENFTSGIVNICSSDHSLTFVNYKKYKLPVEKRFIVSRSFKKEGKVSVISRWAISSF